jgi:hypothetical protein
MSYEHIEQFSVGPFTVTIDYDTNPESPREWSNLGTMVCWHRRYKLGDQHNFSSPSEFQESDEYKNAAIVLPLYLYDHSGITMSCAAFSCPWDSGQVGYIYISRETIRKEYSCKRISKQRLAKVTEYLQSEVKAYDDFITGQVYCYSVEEDGTHIDSCHGFYGLDYCKQEAKQSAEHALVGRAKTDAMIANQFAL